MEGSDDEGALSPDSKRFNGPFSDIRHLVPGTGDFQEFVSNLRTTPGVDLGLLDRSRQGGVQEEEDEFHMGECHELVRQPQYAGSRAVTAAGGVLAEDRVPS
jgi:hypothetical protein